MVIQERKPDKEVQIWQPFKEIEEMERHLDDYIGWPLWRTMWRRRPLADMWAPAMDVIEKDDKFLIKVELPGVKEEDVDISISGDMLTVSGEKSPSPMSRKRDITTPKALMAASPGRLTFQQMSKQTRSKPTSTTASLKLHCQRVPK